jgi:cation diffusion facilitator CzcD-associated flavoprotein CzcO
LEVIDCGFVARLLHAARQSVHGFEACLMVDYDMVVIGSGPSGRRAAIQFAKLNKSVLVVEKGRRVGGVSVHTGTIPSKTLRETRSPGSMRGTG